MAISDNIRICRIQKHMTQKQLGDLLYVSDKTISKWESGRSVPDIYTIKRIADILGVNYELLIDGDEYQKNKDEDVRFLKWFYQQYQSYIILVSALILIGITMISVPIMASYVIGTSMLFTYSIYVIIKRTKWYIVSLMTLIVFIMMQLNGFLKFDLNYITIVIVPITLILLIIQTVRSMRSDNSKRFVDTVGNITMILGIFVFAASLNFVFHGQPGQIELFISKQSGYAIYIVCLMLILFLHNYLYINTTDQNKIMQLIRGRFLLLSGILILLFVLNVLVATTISLSIDHINIKSVYVGHAFYEQDYTEDQINEIKHIYGNDQVTIARYAGITTDHQIYAYTANFIDNGAYVNALIETAHVEKVSLLYGEVWQENSQEKVVVIDQDTAMNSFETIDAVGEYLWINQELWEVIGVVTNTTAGQAYLENAVSNGVDPEQLQLDTYIYVPYFYRDYDGFESFSDTQDMLIVNTQKFISSNKDKNTMIDILVSGNNYDIYHGEHYVRLSITTGSDMIKAYLNMRLGLLLTASMSLIAIVIIEIVSRIKRLKKKELLN